MFDRLRTRLDAGRQDGFTLIELLIVIVILGVLAGIVVFAVGSARGDSVKSSCKADLKSVNTAAEAYKAKKGSYPTKAQLTTGADATLRTFPNGAPDYTVDYADGSGAATGDIAGGAATTDCSA